MRSAHIARSVVGFLAHDCRFITVGHADEAYARRARVTDNQWRIVALTGQIVYAMRAIVSLLRR